MSEHEERNLRVLRHIGRYRLTLRETLSRLFLDGREAGNLVQHLRAEGLVRARSRRDGEGLPKGISYYQLTAKGTRAAGFKDESRARPLAQAELHKALSVLWFCCMRKQRRDRLEGDELARLFGLEELPAPLRGHPHCRDLNWKHPVLHQAYVPSPSALLENVARGVSRRINKARAEPCLQSLLANRSYGILVLIDEPGRRKAIKERLGQLHLHEAARVTLAQAPSPQTLADALSTLISS